MKGYGLELTWQRLCGRVWSGADVAVFVWEDMIWRLVMGASSFIGHWLITLELEICWAAEYDDKHVHGGTGQ